MSKDDYHVLAYRLLSYLYQCLKNGEEVDEAQIYWDEAHRTDKGNERYWNYILKHLTDDGYIEGISFLPVLGGEAKPRITAAVAITPKGIEYLEENSMMKKAYRVWKGIKDIIPGA